MYAFPLKVGETGLIIFRFDELATAINVMQKAGVRILTGEEMDAI